MGRGLRGAAGHGRKGENKRDGGAGEAGRTRGMGGHLVYMGREMKPNSS